MKFHKLIILTLLTFFLCSCAEKNNKDDAYCFSVIFEKNNGMPCVTMYCKTKGNNEENSLNNTPLTFFDTSFKKALLKVENCDKEIYFSSTKAIYFSDELSKDEVFDIVLLLLNKSKYQASVYVYTPYASDAWNLHTEASSVCKNEKVNFNKKSEYTHLGKFIKTFCSEGKFND